VSEGNGCAHTDTNTYREGDDQVIRCAACGEERSRAKDFYQKED
jgi:hypothetical protein